jgi:hypothetical protein
LKKQVKRVAFKGKPLQFVGRHRVIIDVEQFCCIRFEGSTVDTEHRQEIHVSNRSVAIAIGIVRDAVTRNR